LFAQPGDFRRLQAGVGFFQRVEFLLHLAHLQVRRARVGLRRVLLAGGAEQQEFGEEHQRQAQPREPAFEIHGRGVVALLGNGVKSEMTAVAVARTGD